MAITYLPRSAVLTTQTTSLDTEKLPQLIELKYHSVADAVRELGPVGSIREVFEGFQRHLYAEPPG